MEKRKKINLILVLVTICLISCFCVSNMYARYVSKDDTHAFSFDVFANYNVTFDANGGDVVSPSSAEGSWTSVTQDAATKTVEVGAPYGDLPESVRTGYSFESWVTDSRLPAGYQEVEYLESTGTQYIDTGYKPYQSTFGYDIDLIYYNDKNLSGNRTVMAVFDTWSSDHACFSFGGNYKSLCYLDIGWVANGQQSPSCLTPGVRGSVSVINNGDYNETTEKSTYTVTSPLLNATYTVNGNRTVNHSLPVFATCSGSNIQEESHVKLYSLTLLEVKTPVRDFVPAVWKGGVTTYSKKGVRTTGVLPADTAGLYDLVGKVFYINSGLGTFNVGDSVGMMGAVISKNTVMDSSEDHTVFAAWTPNTYTLTLNYNDSGATPDGSLAVIYDENYAMLPTPERIGYGFEGWFDDETAGTQFKQTDVVQITENTTLYARWTANGYAVNFDANGGTLSDSAPITVIFGRPYGELPVPEREGCCFTGWSASRLPAGYQEVEYIEATGTQYVDSGYIPCQSTFGYDIDLIFYNDLPNTRTVMAAFDSWNSDNACFSLGGNYNHKSDCYIDIGWVAGGANTRTCLKHGERGSVSVINNGDFDKATKVSTCKVTSPQLNETFTVSGEKTVKHSLPIFATYNGANIQENAHVKLYSLTLFEVDTPVRDFVPAVWKGGETKYSKEGVTVTGNLPADTAGLYDLAENVFYINSGSGKFKLGDPVGTTGAVIDENTIVALPCNHTLVAQWKEVSGEPSEN